MQALSPVVSPTSRFLASAGTLSAPPLLPPTRFWASQAIFSKPRCHHGNGFHLNVGMHRPGCSEPRMAGGPAPPASHQAVLLLAMQQHKGVAVNSLASLSAFAGCSNELLAMKKGKGERNYSSFFPRRCNSVQGRFCKDPLEGCTLQAFVVPSYTL